MKILIVSAQLPHPGRGGANVRNYYLLKALASQHTVSLLSVVDGAELEAYQAVVELLHSPSMRIALGNAGRALVEAEYSWEQAGTQLLHVLMENC